MLLGFSFIASSFAGCGFLTNDDEADMKQEVAKVDISKYLESEDRFADDVDAVKGILDSKAAFTTIYKSELISYFLNVGYMYVQSYGYSYEDTVNMLMNSLVSRKLMMQYAMAYYLDGGVVNMAGFDAFKTAELAGKTDKEKELLEANPEVLTLKYFLCEGDSKNTEIFDEAVYALKKSVNDALDSTEQTYITADEEEHNHDTQRTLPTNVNTEKEDYIPEVYEIYTGRNVAAECGAYETVEGSTPTTRKQAYNAFLANLQVNNLIGKEDTSDFTLLNYYYVELANQLSQALINKLGEDLVSEAHDNLSANDYAAVTTKYNEMLAYQQAEYTKANGGVSAFETALDGVSDTSFVLYGLGGYGYVYNILLPFSAMQNQEYSAAKNRNLGTAGQYAFRAGLLEDIEGKDQRGSWFVEHEDETHAYLDGTSWKFFKNNLQDEVGKYEKILHYAGGYAYNGTVKTPEETDDGKYETKANGVKIGEFMDIMAGYVKEVSGLETTVYDNTVAEDIAVTENTYVLNAADYDIKDNKIADWSQFIRYEGKFDVTNTNPNYHFVETLADGTANDSYKVLSAFNELMFAYSTDTGCLNTYMGYAVSAMKTSFVSEFEYAAQYVIQTYGVGGYVVCPSDYGWHIIYVSAVYENDGEVYAGGFNKNDVELEGSFSYKLFEALKSSTATQHTTAVQNKVLNDSNNDTCVEFFTKAYQDIIDLDKKQA